MFDSNKLFLKNSFIYFLGLAISGFISFITIPLIIAKFGIDKYGEFSLIQNIVLILIVLGGGWLNQCILRFNDFSSRFKISIFQNYFIVFIPLSVICFFLLYFFGLSFLVCIIGVLTMFLGSVSAMLISFHQSKLNAQKSFYFDFIRIVTFALVVLFTSQLFLKANSTASLIFSFFFSYFVSFLFLLKIDFRLLLTSFKIFIGRFSYKHLYSIVKGNIHLLNYGWPLALWFTFSSLLNISDRYIIGYYLKSSDLGIYSAIYDLIYKGVTLIYSPVLVAGYPIMVHKYNKVSKKNAFQFLRKLIFFEIVIFLCIILSSHFLKSIFIEFVVGIPVTSQSLELILPIICGAFIWQLGMLMHKPLEFELRTKTMLLYVFIALITNIVLNLIFIPSIGIVFASYSTLITACLYLFLNVLELFRLKLFF